MNQPEQLSMFGQQVMTCSHSKGKEPVNPPLSLAKETITSLSKTFESFDHYLNDHQWSALTALATHLEGVAKGEITDGVWLSSLDPGIGKTQLIMHFLRVLKNSTRYDEGVILFLSNYQEISAFIAALGLPLDDIRVLTSDAKTNALTTGDNDAPIFITTQQMLQSRCAGHSFSSISEFHIYGHSRKIRIWDETILPAELITVNRDSIASLLEPIRGVYPHLADRLDGLSEVLRGKADGDTMEVSSLTISGRLGVPDVVRAASLTEAQKETLNDLSILAGNQAVIRKDGQYGNTLVSFQASFPEDLVPLTVTDASGRVRGTYELWEQYRGGLYRLHSAHKDYSNLTIKLWNKGGGRSSITGDEISVAHAIGQLIQTRPKEDWLIVCHKPDPKLDLEKAVKVQLLADVKAHVSFLTWGNHHGTNKFKDVENIILAGTLFYRPSHYEALGRAAGDLSAEGVVLSEFDRKGLIASEQMHLILQALCRASVRKCVNGLASRCNAYIIASDRNGLRDGLKQTFPNCTIEEWRPQGLDLRGKLAEAIEFIEFSCHENPLASVSATDVRMSIGLQDKSNFRRCVRQHPDFIAKCEELGIVEETSKGQVYFNMPGLCFSKQQQTQLAA